MLLSVHVAHLSPEVGGLWSTSQCPRELGGRGIWVRRMASPCFPEDEEAEGPPPPVLVRSGLGMSLLGAQPTLQAWHLPRKTTGDMVMEKGAGVKSREGPSLSLPRRPRGGH